MRSFLKNWANAFRLLLFRSVSADCISVAGWQIAMFGIAGLLIGFFFEFYFVGIEGQFVWEALPLALFPLSTILIAAIVAGYALGSGDKALLLLQVFLMLAAAVDVVVYALYSVSAIPHARRLLNILSYGNYLAPITWLSLACAKAAADLLFVSVPRRALSYIVCATFLFLPLNTVSHEWSLWQQDAPEDEELTSPGAPGRLKEDVVYNEPKVLERELAALKSGRPGVVDIYFIGVAGYGYQDVFMREIDGVSRLFRELFDTEGKSIRLVNNPKTLGNLPVASVTSLRASLRRVAEVMNKEEDILFLFMTSHGSQTYQFSLDLGPLQFHELEPATLRELLDESKIKYRVVVVSACYSGGFVDPLRNENTLVISASAPDKTSFGCSNEAEWTYFGKAYFDESLRRTASFVDAFENAKPLIAQREKKAGYIPSDPQIALGESIKAKLLQLQRQTPQDSGAVK